jgi:hypothetical protein
LKTFIQNFAPSVFSIHSPTMSRAVAQHAQRQVDRLVAHHRVLSDLHPQCVEVHHRVHRLQRPGLPGRDLGHHGVGHQTDELRRHLGAVLLGQEARDLAHRHATCANGHDLVVKARGAPVVLGDQYGLEAALALSWHIDAHRTQHRLGARTGEMIASICRLGAAGRTAQVMAQLAAQRTLDERLLERHRSVLNRLGRHRALDDLVNQFLRDLRQRRRLGGYRRILRFCLAWHTCSCSSCYASHTKFRTGSGLLLQLSLQLLQIVHLAAQPKRASW